MAVLITDIEPSGWVNGKINSSHHLTLDDVEHAVENRIAAAWDDDPERGLRLLVRGPSLNGRGLRIVLFPVDIEQGTFRLGTAFW